MWCYVPKNGEDILEFQQAKVNRTSDGDRTSDGNFSCYLNITSLKPSKGQELQVFIKYGSSATFSQDLAEFDEDDHTTVTVYSCAELGKDCSHCRALKSHYTCRWCSGDGKCQYKNSCMKAENCPRPTVTKIVPRDGPWQGGTEVTISGTELGSQISDIDGVMVAGRPCEVDKKSTNFLIQLNEYFEEGVPSR
ncbi:plexin-B2-like, partial [Mercenaria mercenaria]|uniref:plexin-B2-like n=1 Tax=Mercenaria mercenaria TaxID=6596 RepID=UPI00234F2D14